MCVCTCKPHCGVWDHIISFIEALNEVKHAKAAMRINERRADGYYGHIWVKRKRKVGQNHGKLA